MFSQDVIQHTQSNLVVGNAFTHKYQKDLRKGYKVPIPVMSEISTTEVTPGNQPTAQDGAGTAVSITIDKWYEASIDCSPLIEIEDTIGYLKKAAVSTSYAVNKKVDTTVGSILSALAGGSVQGSDGQVFTDDIFRALVQTLDENDVPDDGRFLIGDPSTKSNLLNIDKFVRGDFVNGSPTTNGQFGTLYNAKVLISNNLTAASTGNYGCYAHPDAIGVVLQKGVSSKMWNLGWKFQLMLISDAAWGYAEMRDVFGKSFYTESS